MRYAIKARGQKDLERKIEELQGETVPVIVGEAGIGKSHSMEEVSKGYDIAIIRRMSGITDEIITGIPNIQEDEHGKYFDFLKMGFIKTIQDNPNKRVFLFIDEINRTPVQLRQALFELFERRIEGKFYPNLTVVSAVNIGDNYDESWNFGSDKALLSRVTMIEYSISDKEIIEKAKVQFGFNSFLVDLMERVGDIVSQKMAGDDELEQQTNIRSWRKLNNVCGVRGIATIEELSKMIHEYAFGVLSNPIALKAMSCVEDMLRLKKSLQLEKLLVLPLATLEKDLPSIMSTNNVSVLELALSTKEFLSKSSNIGMLEKYPAQCLYLLNKRKDCFIAFFQDMSKLNLIDRKVLLKIIPMLSDESRKTIMQIVQQ